MAKISASGLTFCYDGSYDDIFYEASFIMDTNWKLGLIGRNGKGKTTLLRLLMGQYSYRGSISSSVLFDYFPFQIQKEDMERDTIEVIERIQPDYELWRICRELELLHVEADILYRPYQTLSHGERTKVMLAVFFSRENYFLLIDEPTNHLDMETRELLCAYLNRKKGFILVSHDRWLLDSCIDHVLALERNQIEVEKGNFTSWWENKQRRDQYEISENEKLKQEIKKMEESARKASAWAEKAENTKIGFNPLKEHDRFLDTRAYIGEKARRMQQRRKNLERRQQTAIREKEQPFKKSGAARTAQTDTPYPSQGDLYQNKGCFCFLRQPSGDPKLQYGAETWRTHSAAGKKRLRKIQYSENDPARRRHAPSRGKGFLCTGTA